LAAVLADVRDFLATEGWLAIEGWLDVAAPLDAAGLLATGC
jgi:hypothetical protein